MAKTQKKSLNSKSQKEKKSKPVDKQTAYTTDLTQSIEKGKREYHERHGHAPSEVRISMADYAILVKEAQDMEPTAKISGIGTFLDMAIIVDPKIPRGKIVFLPGTPPISENTGGLQVHAVKVNAGREMGAAIEQVMKQALQEQRVAQLEFGVKTLLVKIYKSSLWELYKLRRTIRREAKRQNARRN